MKNILAAIGGVTIALAILGSIGVGNFHYYYGPGVCEVKK